MLKVVHYLFTDFVKKDLQTNKFIMTFIFIHSVGFMLPEKHCTLKFYPHSVAYISVSFVFNFSIGQFTHVRITSEQAVHLRNQLLFLASTK